MQLKIVKSINEVSKSLKYTVLTNLFTVYIFMINKIHKFKGIKEYSADIFQTFYKVERYIYGEFTVSVLRIKGKVTFKHKETDI